MGADKDGPTGLRIDLKGTVQGVGFRPFVFRSASRLGLSGRVWNHGGGVTIEVFGPESLVRGFADELPGQVPAAAVIVSIATTRIPHEVLPGFSIEESHGPGGTKAISIPADIATCEDCLSEIRDPDERRYGYAFTNCTQCGPRFSIATGIPYDRPATTMAGFPLCEECRREYGDPVDRRFHAQPIACPRCGPHLQLVEVATRAGHLGDPLLEAARRLLAGEIVAIKGLGGFHLACDATSAAAVTRLRERKHREEKPFAVMVTDLVAARSHARLSEAEASLLQSPTRPIVLVHGHPDSVLASEVSPNSPLVGLFLPYTPLHHLLLEAVRRPLVMTSGNLSDEPIAFRDEDALSRLSAIADAILLHDRPIENPCDDSVARVMLGRPLIMRRSRGYVPTPVPLATPIPVPLLACGAQLKNTFCLAAGDTAFLGPHIGDLDNAATLAAFEEAIVRLSLFTGIKPEVIVHDLHPDYLSTRYAARRPEFRKIGVQHHHAHVAAAMAEHGLQGKVIGVAYDGTGLGDDGSAWGGEILDCTPVTYARRCTLRPIPLAGGDRAMSEVWRIALALLDDAFDGQAPLDGLRLFSQLEPAKVAGVRSLLAAGLNSPKAHGAGRYFDALGALCLGLPDARFEGQVAMALNVAATDVEKGVYPFVLDRSGPTTQIDFRPMVRELVRDLRARVPSPTVAARFHDTLAEATATYLRESSDPGLPVILTGGCFQNDRLTASLVRRLRPGRQVFLHSHVPCGDGGLALGQALIAGALLANEAAKP